MKCRAGRYRLNPNWGKVVWKSNFWFLMEPTTPWSAPSSIGTAKARHRLGERLFQCKANLYAATMWGLNHDRITAQWLNRQSMGERLQTRRGQAEEHVCA